MALEQFFLLNEVESIFHVSPQLMSSLQRWILSKSEQTFDKNSNLPSGQIEARALDILEWAPMESLVNQQEYFFQYFGLRLKDVFIVTLNISIGHN